MPVLLDRRQRHGQHLVREGDAADLAEQVEVHPLVGIHQLVGVEVGQVYPVEPSQECLHEVLEVDPARAPRVARVAEVDAFHREAPLADDVQPLSRFVIGRRGAGGALQVESAVVAPDHPGLDAGVRGAVVDRLECDPGGRRRERQRQRAAQHEPVPPDCHWLPPAAPRRLANALTVKSRDHSHVVAGGTTATCRWLASSGAPSIPTTLIWVVRAIAERRRKPCLSPARRPACGAGPSCRHRRRHGRSGRRGGPGSPGSCRAGRTACPDRSGRSRRRSRAR